MNQVRIVKMFARQKKYAIIIAGKIVMMNKFVKKFVKPTKNVIMSVKNKKNVRNNQMEKSE